MIAHGSQGGWGLVELMLSAALGLFLLTVVISVLGQTSAAYRLQDDLARLQEHARFATGIIAHDVRMSGYFGCGHDPAHRYSDHSPGPSSLPDVRYALEGFEQGRTQWFPSGGDEKSDEFVPDSDAITLRYADTTTRTSVSAAMGAPDAPIAVATNSLRENDLAIITDCESAHVFQVARVDNDDRIVPVQLGKAYAAGSQVMMLRAIRYYIGTSTTDGLPSLKRQVLQGGATTTTEELVQGVENMQWLYGFDSDGDAAPDTYVPAHEVPQWDRVVSVQLGLLIRGLHGVKDTRKQNHRVLDFEFNDPDDHPPQREVVTLTMDLRNAPVPARP